MIEGQNFFDQSVKNNLKTYYTPEKLLYVKGMITQLPADWTIIISKTIIR